MIAAKINTSETPPDEADAMKDKLAAEQAAGRAAMERAKAEPVCDRTISALPDGVTLENFNGVTVGPAPRGGLGRIVQMRVRDASNVQACEAVADQCAYLADRYARSEARANGRPPDPVLETEIVAAVSRIGGGMTRRPALIAEIGRVLTGKRAVRSDNTIKSRILKTADQLAEFAATVRPIRVEKPVKRRKSDA